MNLTEIPRWRSLPTAGLLLGVIALSACGSQFETASLTETGHEIVRKLPTGPSTSSQADRVVLVQAMNVRKDVANILEFAAELPEGAIIEIPENHEIRNLDYRAGDGTLARSSTGFVRPITLISVPSKYSAQFPASKIDELNNTAGGLHISASIIGTIEGSDGNFDALTGADPSSDFLLNYEASGKPKFTFTVNLKKHFGEHLNQGVDPSSQSAHDRTKFSKLYRELAKVGDRTKALPRSYLIVDNQTAQKNSIDYEQSGIVPLFGAWSTAVEATAVRHGFPNVPCAEFMSEMIREAYQRAGFPHTEDFNTARGNPLIWSSTAAVQGLSQALYDAGWIPWDTVEFRPMPGAILMHGSGRSPGHTFMAAGDDGRFIVDNGSPQGRDLRKTTDKTIKLMYMEGVFFLPPGINPPKW